MNNELYVAYSDSGTRTVARGRGGTLEPVGQPGFARGGSIELFGKNGRLYAVIYSAGILHEQLIVTTPE